MRNVENDSMSAQGELEGKLSLLTVQRLESLGVNQKRCDMIEVVGEGELAKKSAALPGKSVKRCTEQK
jgi:hypothetical protein